MKKILNIFFIILLSFVLTSCSLIFKKESTKGYKEKEPSLTYDETSELYNHYKRSQVSFNSLSYESIFNSAGGDYMPSTGDVNVLVLPIEIKGYEFNDNYKELLDIAINGKDTDTNYWESLSSFYYKSSYNKLNIKGYIADKYETNLTPYQLIKKNKSLPDTSIEMVNLAFESFKEKDNSPITNFDNDINGTVDAIIAIYSSPDTSNDYYMSTLDPNNDLFWAYSYQLSDYFDRNINSPIANNYLWMSIDFFYIDNESNYINLNNNPRIDCHTLIHETGHLMGLDDYYSYDSYRNPCGGFDMMDENIGDHSAFSKLSLGWIDPYYVYGNATLTINDFESSGDVILLADNWNNTAFDEYILIELYTPTHLNYLDATYQYKNKEKLYSNVGIKIWHVDSRVIEIQDNKGDISSRYIDNEPSILDDDCYYQIAASNSDIDNVPDKYRYDLLRLIENNTDILENRRFNDGYATNDSLWYENDSFELTKKSNMFPRASFLNNGNELNYEIVIDKLTSTSATITINAI